MFAYPFRAAALAVSAAVGLSACTTPYGYGGVSVGAGNGYYDPYYGDYGYGAGYGYNTGYPGYGYGYGYGAGYPGYGYGYGFEPYWGWYDDCYYPGTGYYVYDSYRRPKRWTDAQRRYWTERRERALSSNTSGKQVVIRDNWEDFSRPRATVRPERPNRTDRTVSRPVRVERGQPARVERTSRPVRVERSGQQQRNTHAERVERSSRPVRTEEGNAQQRVEHSTRPERVERTKVQNNVQARSEAREARRTEARSPAPARERSNGRAQEQNQPD